MRKSLRRMSDGIFLYELAQQIAVFGIGAVFNENFGAFVRSLAAQIGNAVFRDDNVYAVLVMVAVRYVRHNRANHAALRDGRTSINGGVCRTREVAAAADSVHQVFAHDVRAVYVAGKVDLDGRVDGNNSYAARDFGAV